MLQSVSQMVRSFDGGTLGQCRWTFRWLDLIVCYRLLPHLIPFPVHTLIQDRGLFISRPSQSAAMHRIFQQFIDLRMSYPSSTSFQSILVLTRQVSEQLPSPNQSIHPFDSLQSWKILC